MITVTNELLTAYANELAIDLERMARYRFAAYLVSPLRTTIAAHFVRLYQQEKIEFEQALNYVDILEGETSSVSIQLRLPKTHKATSTIVTTLIRLGFRQIESGDTLTMLL